MSAELDLMPLFREAVENLGEWITAMVPDADATLAADMVALAIDYGFDADTITDTDGELYLRVKTDDAVVRVWRQIVGDYMRSADYDGSGFAAGDATDGWNIDGDGIEAANMRARGRFETAATGRHVAVDFNSIDFFTGDVDETVSGKIQVDSSSPKLEIWAPQFGHGLASITIISSESGAGSPSGHVSLAGEYVQINGDLRCLDNTVQDVADPTAGTHVGDRDYNDSRYGGGSTRIAQARRTAGDVSTSSTSYVDVTGMTATVAAKAGDWLQISASGRWGNQAVTKRMDAIMQTSSNYASGDGSGGLGVAAWGGITGQTAEFGGSVFYQVVSGDISGGNVEVRLRMKMSSGTSGTVSGTSPILEMTVRNCGS